VRLEYKGEVWVASGDYKVEPDGTCAPFEPVRCHTFITESTFGLPIYKWPAQTEVFREINDWWRANAAAGRASVLFCYAFGKAQRILHGLDESIGTIVVHGAVEPLNKVYREGGIHLPVVEVFAGPGAENDQVGKTACQRMATGVPVCHIEQAHTDVGAELLQRRQPRSIAPAGDNQMAICREGFRQTGADAGAGASDEHRHHERTLRFTPRTAQPSRGRCS